MEIIKMLSKKQEIIKLIFKDFLTFYNSRSISKLIGISHAGAFKILKKLEKKEIVKARRIGKAVIYSLNMENPVAQKEVEMILIIEAQNYRRWIEEFRKLDGKIRFLILFGSILVNEKSANDIDLLVVAEKSNFSEIKKVIKEREKFSNKKIHLILQTLNEFKEDVAKKNKAIIEIIKKGVVLSGQDEFRKLLTK